MTGETGAETVLDWLTRLDWLTVISRPGTADDVVCITSLGKAVLAALNEAGASCSGTPRATATQGACA